MDETESKIKVKPLRRNTDESKFNLYKAALEWSLIDPIVIESKSDLKSRKEWADKVSPFDHQVKNLITFCRRLPVTLLADDVGLGKTISAGLVMSELISRNRISKILIVCPKLLIYQWQEELISKFGIKSTIAIGSDLIEAEPLDGEGAVITTYTSARIHLDKIVDRGYDMLILDEAHKLRNLYGVDKTPQVAKRFQQALADRMFKYVLMLTATPIQNRLWDIYSLVDLLSTARGHENPFGSEGLFHRKFIGDKRDQARELKFQAKDEFRDIVYSYMSRIRRADANLPFPERVIHRHIVEPTSEELDLFKIVSESIKDLNRLSQIGILKALVSSPEALLSWLNSMARNGTIDPTVRDRVAEIASRTKITAKLNGLAELVKQLRAENPDSWRMVVFTCSRETQTTIQVFLESQDIHCGLINGDTGSKNSDTIKRFQKDPPEIHVIISTEAGSEGVNLQVSNVLVNYDLPWNPMIVEQRIGRVQRLGSKHANVSIFNMTLKGTFEEYIVNRLMEKLQMAAHAIGDIEALLESTGIDEGSEDKAEKFEDKILDLVLSSLKGIDTEKAAVMAEESIRVAKERLEQEEKNIENLLGGQTEDFGPKIPKLPEISRSMSLKSFVIKSLESLGSKVSEHENGAFISEQDGKRELIEFEKGMPKQSITSVLYKPGSSAFERLVTKMTEDGLFLLSDLDNDPEKTGKDIAQRWVKSFDGNLQSVELESVDNRFEGKVLLHVKVTVAHDSYERLVEVQCEPGQHSKSTKSNRSFVAEFLSDPSDVGVDFNRLTQSALVDPGVSEFCKFYEERKKYEVKSAGSDERKKKKLEDDFTPRISITLVALDGSLHRELQLNCSYKFEPGYDYKNTLSVIPSSNSISILPEMKKCEVTGINVPVNCLGLCEISGKHVLLQKLKTSESSGRNALPEYFVTCSFSKKNVLKDEVKESDVSGKLVLTSLMKQSALSGKMAEPIYFDVCDFSNSELLKAELCVSDVSKKSYRMDEKLVSSVSGKTGHKSEFIKCSQTNKPLLSEEAEVCEITNAVVSPGILETCSVTGKKVLPSQLEQSSFSSKKALKEFFVTSSLSDKIILETEAIKSAEGKYCSPIEALACTWSGKKYHPDDIRDCRLTNLPMHFSHMNEAGHMKVLNELLDGSMVGGAHADLEDAICKMVSALTDYKNAQIKSSARSESKKLFALCVEIKAFFGFKTRYVGLICSGDKKIKGQICIGKRDQTKWIFESVIPTS